VTGERSLAYLAAVPVDRVKGIGPKTARRMEEAAVASVADLLFHTPRRYLDRSQLFDLSDVPLGEEVTVGGVVDKVRRRRISRNRTMIEATISDGSSTLHAVWFNPYLRLDEGTEVALSGKAELFRGRLQMKAPDVDTLEGEDSLVTGRIVPVYPALAAMGQHKLRGAIANALRRSRPIAEILPEDVLDRVDLIERDRALAHVHFPETREDADAARRRLIFDELFRLEVALALRKQQQMGAESGVAHDVGGTLVAGFLDGLPFGLTGAQQRVISEIRHDLASAHPMHRLLQGEVGSGKTVVAVVALLTAVQSGYQGAIMAPTEVLAAQHYLGVSAALADASLAPAGMFGSATPVRVALLTANVAETNEPSATTRADVLEQISSGGIDIVIGTHALIQEGVAFHRLGLAVVDEQHRFGVYQRVQLRDKSTEYDPDLLIMTATPIPRTLAMTLYGDLDVSLLDEMPPGRAPVRTIHETKAPPAQERTERLVRTEVAAGRQVFVVCPLVEDSDKLEAKSATAEFERLEEVYPDLRLGLIHGQMRPGEKEQVMGAFRTGAIDVLVATTVIEVGIDVPNATVMVIEDADRFGLSQLHQLRGRVGRGGHAATCVLVAEPSTIDGEERLAAMVATTDGFRLAEEDLRIRGQGTVFGARQAGMTDLRLADILRDADLLVAARREAFRIVGNDPTLADHAPIADEVTVLLGERTDWLLRS